MRRSFLTWWRQNGAVSLLLAMLLLRAYVPVGFMPASGTPFLLELCPGTASLPMPAHHHHPDTHGHFDHCPFGSSPAAGPVSQLLVFLPPPPAVEQSPPALQSQLGSIRLPSAHQPRAPPSLA